MCSFPGTVYVNFSNIFVRNSLSIKNCTNIHSVHHVSKSSKWIFFCCYEDKNISSINRVSQFQGKNESNQDIKYMRILK